MEHRWLRINYKKYRIYLCIRSKGFFKRWRILSTIILRVCISIRSISLFIFITISYFNREITRISYVTMFSVLVFEFFHFYNCFLWNKKIDILSIEDPPCMSCFSSSPKDCERWLKMGGKISAKIKRTSRLIALRGCQIIRAKNQFSSRNLNEQPARR